MLKHLCTLFVLLINDIARSLLAFFLRRLRPRGPGGPCCIMAYHKRTGTRINSNRKSRDSLVPGYVRVRALETRLETRGSIASFHQFMRVECRLPCLLTEGDQKWNCGMWWKRNWKKELENLCNMPAIIKELTVQRIYYKTVQQININGDQPA